MDKQDNNLMSRYSAVTIAFLIAPFGITLFLAGHYIPGGGFVNGLLLSTALAIIMIAFGTKATCKIFPWDFRILIGISLLSHVGTPIASWFCGKNFLIHTEFNAPLSLLHPVHVNIPIFLDFGTICTAIGTAITVIITIGENE